MKKISFESQLQLQQYQQQQEKKQQELQQEMQQQQQQQLPPLPPPSPSPEQIVQEELNSTLIARIEELEHFCSFSGIFVFLL